MSSLLTLTGNDVAFRLPPLFKGLELPNGQIPSDRHACTADAPMLYNVSACQKASGNSRHVGLQVSLNPEIWYIHIRPQGPSANTTILSPMGTVEHRAKLIVCSRQKQAKTLGRKTGNTGLHNPLLQHKWELSQVTQKIVPLRHFFSHKVVPLTTARGCANGKNNDASCTFRWNEHKRDQNLLDKMVPSCLYCMQVSLQIVEAHASGVLDQVSAYFGMRKIEVAPDAKGAPRIKLNGKVELNIGLLDQGFWPDGLYTAPSGTASVPFML